MGGEGVGKGQDLSSKKSSTVIHFIISIATCHPHWHRSRCTFAKMDAELLGGEYW